MAFLVVYLAQGEEAVRRLWGKCFLKQNRLKYYSLALVSIAALGGLSLLIRYLYDGQAASFSELPDALTLAIGAPFLLLFPGFTEEFGWRGFLQERLQDKMGVFLASLLTGLVWGSWHSMDFLMGNWPTDYFSITVFFLYITATSIIIGGIYVLSGGSVFIAMLVHFSANVVNFLLPVWKMESSELTPLIYIGLLWVAAFMVLGVKRPVPQKENIIKS